MNNEKEIIYKLFLIAKNQQKFIHKLAQGLVDDPNIKYLERAAAVAATNTGIRVPIGASAHINKGSQGGNVDIESTYTVNISGIFQADESTKNNFLKIYQHQITSQKPELAGRVSIFFE